MTKISVVGRQLVSLIRFVTRSFVAVAPAHENSSSSRVQRSSYDNTPQRHKNEGSTNFI